MDEQHLLIEVELPEGHWAGDASRGFHDTFVRIEEHMPLSEERGTARITLHGARPREMFEWLKAHPNVLQLTEYETETDETVHAAIVVSKVSALHRPIQQTFVIPRTPFEVRHSKVLWAIATTSDQARALLSALRETVRYEVKSYGATKEDRLLTARQRQVFDEALRKGYYDAPRKLTLTQLAGELEMSKSTLCEMLHLIEYQIISTFSEEVREKSPLA